MGDCTSCSALGTPARRTGTGRSSPSTGIGHGQIVPLLSPAPFLDAQLKDGAPAADIAPVTAFETGMNKGCGLPYWPAAAQAVPLYLGGNGILSLARPALSGAATTSGSATQPSPSPIANGQSKLPTSRVLHGKIGWSTGVGKRGITSVRPCSQREAACVSRSQFPCAKASFASNDRSRLRRKERPGCPGRY